LAQLVPKEPPVTRFGKEYSFGFFVGMVIGDAHKPKQGRGHRNVHVVLSKRYDTNVKIGDFTSFCATRLRLRMARQKDIPKPPDKPFGFREWVSQASPFVDWIFNVVLGLNDGQHTTYDEVRKDWALEAPFEFRLGLLHGIGVRRLGQRGESDRGVLGHSRLEIHDWTPGNFRSQGISKPRRSLSRSHRPSIPSMSPFFRPVFEPGDTNSWNSWQQHEGSRRRTGSRLR
jgi:hypothetical protein